MPDHLPEYTWLAFLPFIQTINNSSEKKNAYRVTTIQQKLAHLE
jgi:hypothetical protein